MRKRIAEKKERHKTRGVMIGTVEANFSINGKNYNNFIKHSSNIQLEKSDQEVSKE